MSTVDLPVMPPVKPMLAKPLAESKLSTLTNVQFEAKWDHWRLARIAPSPRP